MAKQSRYENQFDLEVLKPAEARKRLQELYKQAAIDKPVPDKDVPKLLEKYREDPFAFLTECFPHRFPKKPGFADFHKDIWHTVDKTLHKLVIVNAFRGSGKSSMMTFGRLLWTICFEQANYIVLGSYNLIMAKRLLFPIMLELETNARLKQLFGKLQGDRIWNTQSCITANDIRIDALGIGMTSRGSLHRHERPDLFIVDDAVNNESARSENQTDSLLAWLFQDMLPAMRLKNWRAYMLATMITDTSAPYKLQYAPEYDNKVKRVLWNIETNGNPTWESRFNHEAIDRIKSGITDIAYRAEYQMPPLSSDERLFHQKYIHYYKEAELDHRRLYTVAFNDPAIGTGRSHDYSAIVVLSYDRDTGQMYVRSGTAYRKMTPDETVQHCYFLDRLYSGITIIFEGNGFQRLYEYIFKLQRQIKGYQPKYQSVTRSDNKRIRMMGLIPYFTNEMVYFLTGDEEQKRGIDDMLKLSIKDDPKYHDDFPDGLEGAVTHVQAILRSVGMAAAPSVQHTVQRQQKSVAQTMAHKPQKRHLWWQTEDSMSTIAEQLLRQPKPEETPVESALESMVKQALIKQQPILCTQDEYLDIRQYLFKWRDSWQTLQPTCATFASEEIRRLDKQYLI